MLSGPRKPKKLGEGRDLNELSDEQLERLFAPLEPERPLFLLTMEGRPALGALIVIVLGLLLWLSDR